MTGSIIKRGERNYLLRISLGRDTVTGKRLYYTETIHGTRRDADARLRKKLDELDGGGIIPKSAKTLNEFMEQWLKVVAGRVKRASHSQYEEAWKRHIKETIGRLHLTKINTMVVQEYYTKLGEIAGPATIRQIHMLLHSAFKQAAQWRLVAFNPTVDTVRPIYRKSKKIHSMDLDQAVAFIAATHQVRQGYLLRFLLTTGMRPEEAFALQWSDIDFVTGEVRIERALIRPRSGGGWYFDTPKSESSRRRIALDARDLADLHAWRERQQMEKAFAGERWLKGHDFVFTTIVGTPVSNSNLKAQALNKCFSLAGADKKRLYDLRHTSATLLLLAKEQAKIVSERLGHASIGITMDTYSHVLPAMERQASKTIADILRP